MISLALRYVGKGDREGRRCPAPTAMVLPVRSGVNSLDGVNDPGPPYTVSDTDGRGFFASGALACKCLALDLARQA